MSTKILVVEDDSDIADLIKLNLSDEGYKIDIVSDGLAGYEQARTGKYGLIILDIMLPNKTGTDICADLRKANFQIPILLLSVKSDLIDKVLGLELGADDYLTKPFAVQELIARVRALLRRGSPSDSEQVSSPAPIERGELTIDPSKHRVMLSDEQLELTPKQFDLLYFLAKSPGRTYTRSDLLSYVWGYQNEGYEHTVDSHINRLRSKIEPDPSNPQYILTVWGVGYKFTELFDSIKKD